MSSSALLLLTKNEHPTFFQTRFSNNEFILINTRHFSWPLLLKAFLLSRFSCALTWVTVITSCFFFRGFFSVVKFPGCAIILSVRTILNITFSPYKCWGVEDLQFSVPPNNSISLFQCWVHVCHSFMNKCFHRVSPSSSWELYSEVLFWVGKYIKSSVP